MPETPTQTELKPQQILLSWQAPAQPKHERSHRWYMIAGGFVLACAAYGILTGAWSFTIVMVLCGATFFLVHDHVPPLKTISISDQGVLLEEKFVSWDNLSGFWLLQTQDYTELHILQKTPREPELLIQTGRQDLTQLRMLLGSKIPERTDKRERFLDALTRLAKL